jgi:hypothetical protein
MEADWNEAPFRALDVESVTVAGWGTTARARGTKTLIAEGTARSWRLHLGLRFEGERVAEVWSLPLTQEPSPNRFEMRYIGGWPGLDRPIDVVTVELRPDVLLLFRGPIPDVSLATHVLSGQAKVVEQLGQFPAASVIAAELVDGRVIEHTARGWEIAQGAIGGALVGGWLMADTSPTAQRLGRMAGAERGARSVAAQGVWQEHLERLLIMVEPRPGETRPATVLFEELPARQSKDKRGLPTGFQRALTLWTALAAARLAHGTAVPLRSLAAPFGPETPSAGGTSTSTPEKAQPTPRTKRRSLAERAALAADVARSEIRRLTGSQSEPGGRTVDVPSAPAAVDRLEELDSLLEAGLLTQAEHEEKRRAILRGV